MRTVPLLALLAACTGPVTEVAWDPVVSGTPMAGAAESRREVPIGVPLGCFSSRSKVLGSSAYVDRRQGSYNTGFDESGGIHTRSTLKVLWLENGDDNLVIIKIDACLGNDGLVQVVTDELEAATGEDLDGRVVISVSHSHSSTGCYADQWHWFLGVDRYNEEIFERNVDQLVTVALQAHSNRQEAAIGSGWAFDWDPAGLVYRDRRGENNDLLIWEDQADWVTDKDPHMNMLKVESTEGEPIAMMVTFGMHGTSLGGDNPLISRDSSGGVESVVSEHFPGVVMHMQGAGGDASPGGSDRHFARIETIGEYALQPILDLWEDTPTSSDAIDMESASGHVWQHHSQIEVTRTGTTDLRYSELQPLEGYTPDNEVYADDGSIISPIDEFNAEYGAAFCGGDPLFPVGGINAEVAPYDSCTDVSLLASVIAGTFDYNQDDIHLPFAETMKAGTTATKFGPIPTLLPDGSTESRPFTGGFFPGEVTATFAEQWRRRADAELGWNMPVTFGYSQDHEGYLLIPEDWLLGGYEPNINLWGPLQGEHIMEGMLNYAPALNTPVHEDIDPTGYSAPTEFTPSELPTFTPDLTPTAGTLHTAAPVEDFFLPPGLSIDLTMPAQVERMQMIQIAWSGGDAMVDPPHVYVERDNAGTWERVQTAMGRPVSEAMTDILVTHTPDPLFPKEDPQDHHYFAAWQAVGHVKDRAGLPLGSYRLVVEGKTWDGGDTTWPWTTSDYTIETASFEVTPATVSLQSGDGGLYAWMVAPAQGWRLVDLEGNSQGLNPVRGTISVSVDGAAAQDIEVQSIAGGKAFIPIDVSSAASVTATDSFGNSGSL